jgi:hypothetical protein
MVLFSIVLELQDFPRGVVSESVSGRVKLLGKPGSPTLWKQNSNTRLVMLSNGRKGKGLLMFSWFLKVCAPFIHRYVRECPCGN